MERIVPDDLNLLQGFDTDTLQLHLERYQFAIRQLRPGRILDMACGTGYGSSMLVNDEKMKGSSCISVDNSPTAISYASKRYSHDAIEFICEDAMKFDDRLLFDGIVSLETIEHFKQPELLVSRLYQLLKPNGILIVSAPVTPSTDGNPYHLSDFSPVGFRGLFKSYPLEEKAHLLQVQSYLPYLFRSSKNSRLSGVRNELWRFYLRHPTVFYSRICSLFRDGFKNKYLVLALQKH
jgi:2-polyprenyl-3-methyl-5-hydroxy-6-metoxy-1,4-benzoquinol methylase